MENNKIEIIQKLETEDIIAYNMYLLKQKVSIYINGLVLGIISIGTGIYSLIDEWKRLGSPRTISIVICSILIVLGIGALFGTMPIIKLSVKRKIIKKNENLEPILVTLSDEGVMLQFAKKEESEQFTPYQWDKINKAVEKNNYIFIHVDRYITLIIKKSECDKIEEVRQYLQEKLPLRYILKLSKEKK